MQHYRGSLGEIRRVRSFVSRTERWPKASLGGAAGVAPDSVAGTAILLAEENPTSLSFLKNILQIKGYRVLEALNGIQALDIAEAEKLDLILLDLQLALLNRPEVPGVIEQLRANPRLEKLPIVLMTAQETEAQRRSAVAAGCDDFLRKPIDFHRLDRVLNYFVPLQAEA